MTARNQGATSPTGAIFSYSASRPGRPPRPAPSCRSSSGTRS